MKAAPGRKKRKTKGKKMGMVRYEKVGVWYKM